jgi:geranylgeranyl diphosphate synthase type I
VDECVARAREELLRFKGRADDRLRVLARGWVDGSLEGDRSPSPRELAGAVVDLTLRGGKRVRPALACFAARCFDHGLDEASLLDAALSVEVLQTYLLIHDDVMDGDPERRGGPSVHVAMARLAGDEALGRSLAILAGDLACAMAQDLLVRAGLPAARLGPAMAELVRMQWDVIQGQHLDMVGGAAPAVVQDAKTASYTTRGPVRLGAALAGAEAEAMSRLERYGTPLGRAFQIRDDLLGTFGNAADLGKPVGADLRAGKRTELIEAALAAANEAQRAALLAVQGNPAASAERVAAACRVIEETGARRRSEAMVEGLTAEALDALEGAGLRAEGLELLRGVALLLAGRDR